MPYFCLETNVPDEKIPADLPAKLCEVMAESSGKPLDVCCASVTGGVKMSWGGNNEPAALATFVGLAAIGVIGVEENKKHTKAFTDYLTKSIGIRADSASVTGGVKMSWGGNNEPAALATFVGLAALGVIGVEENKKHSKAITDYITKSIGIRADRIYITFLDAKTSGVGFKGTTFHEILGF